MVDPFELEVARSVSKIKDGVPIDLEFIAVKTTETDRYQGEAGAKTDKAHLLMVLSPRHYNECRDKRSMAVNSGSNRTFMGSGSGDKRQKTYNNSARYNRIVFYADCLDPGRVVCKILETHKESVQYFNNMLHNGLGVGSLYVVEE